ncbi:unnamed protein product, partial [marine sediment metagenome]
GIGKGAEYGILFKNSAALEQVHKVTAVVLDKTGTITNGQLAITDIEPTKMSSFEKMTSFQRQEELLRLAASAEQGSEHPLGEAIVGHAKTQGLTLSVPAAFEAFAGYGITANVDGRDVLLGNLRLMRREDVTLNGLEAKAQKMQN